MTLITDLEHQLTGPDALTEKQRLVQHLRDIELRLRGKLVHGLPPEIFRQVIAGTEACAAAQDVVQDYKPGDQP